MSVGARRIFSVKILVNSGSLYGQFPFSVRSSHFSVNSYTESTFLTDGWTQSPLREVNETIEIRLANFEHFFNSLTS